MQCDSIRFRKSIDNVVEESWTKSKGSYASQLPTHMLCRANPLIQTKYIRMYPDPRSMGGMVWEVWDTLAGQTLRQSRHSFVQVVRAALMEIQLN